MKRSYLYVALVLLFTALILGYNYLYQDHRDIKTEQAEFSGNAKTLKTIILENPDSLLNKTVEIQGLITQKEANGIVLDSAVYCVFTSSITNLKVNQIVNIKGRCIGYDDLFELVNLDQCSITN